jgi:hypothetical protein
MRRCWMLRWCLLRGQAEGWGRRGQLGLRDLRGLQDQGEMPGRLDRRGLQGRRE